MGKPSWREWRLGDAKVWVGVVLVPITTLLLFGAQTWINSQEASLPIAVVDAALTVLVAVVAGIAASFVYAQTIGIEGEEAAIQRTAAIAADSVDEATQRMLTDSSGLRDEIFRRMSLFSTFIPTRSWDPSDEDRPGFNEEIGEFLSASSRYSFSGLTGNGVAQRLKNCQPVEVRVIVASPNPAVNSDFTLARNMRQESYPARYMTLSGDGEVARQVRFDTCRALWELQGVAQRHKEVYAVLGPLHVVRYEIFDDCTYRAAWTPMFSKFKYPATFRFEGEYSKQLQQEFHSDFQSLEGSKIDCRQDPERFKARLLKIGFDEDTVEWSRLDVLNGRASCYKDYVGGTVGRV